MKLEIVILAAGKGTRMRSDLPKVLHPVGGRPMLAWVIGTAQALKPAAVHVVTGHRAELVEKLVADLPQDLKARVRCVRQAQQRGTADAVAAALPEVADDADVLVLYGDTPLVRAELLKTFIKETADAPLGVLSAHTDTPKGYGRIIRDARGGFDCIIEEKDASDAQRLVKEINTGIIRARAAVLKEWLPKIGNHNAQGEYYLTDLAGLLRRSGLQVAICKAPEFETLAGVNSKFQLAQAERCCQRTQSRRLMDEYGVTLADPERLEVRGSLECGRDCFIDINCVFEGQVKLGDRVTICAGCVIKDCTIGDDSVISPYTVMEGSELHKENTIGPFARLRAGNVLEDRVHIGDFVEVKKSRIGAGTKAGHLSYLGDAKFGKDINVGAGTITCNYDGANKHRTVVGDDVFIGSDTQLVAPVEVPAHVTIGAGTTYTHRIEAKEGDLVITRPREAVVPGFARPQKQAK